MSRFAELLLQWVQTGIRCSHIPTFVQPPSNPNTHFAPSHATAHVADEDIIMESSSLATLEVPFSGFPDFSGNIDDLLGKALNELQTFTQQLLDRDPRTLSPHEKTLLQMLHQRQEQANLKLGRSDSIRDEIMKSPTPVRTHPPQAQPSVAHERDEVRIKLEGVASGAGTTFKSTHGRHHPYLRPHATPQTDGAPKRFRKKVSSGFLADRETRQQKGRLLKKERELEEAREEAERARMQMEENAWRLKVEMKKLEVLEWAKKFLWENEGPWDESAFRAQHADFLQEEAERLCREEGVLNRQREENDGQFARAVAYIDHLFKEQIDRQHAVEQSSRDEIRKVDEEELRLAEAIQEARAKFKRLREERGGLPDRRKQWDDRLQAIIDTKTQLLSSHSEMLEFLEGAMRETGQDFFEAWKGLQVRFCTGPDFWPPGLTPTPTRTQPHASPSTLSSEASSSGIGGNSSHSSCSSATITPLDSSETTNEPPIPPPSTSSSPNSESAQTSSFPQNPTCPPPSSAPPTSTSSNSAAQTPPPPNKFLPTRRPRNTAERMMRYKKDWELLKSGELSDEAATFDQVPWPVLVNLRKGHLDDLTAQRLEKFLFHPSRLSGKTPHKILLEELLRWHADKLGVVLGKFIPEDRPFIQAAGNRIAALLLQIRDSL